MVLDESSTDGSLQHTDSEVWYKAQRCSQQVHCLYFQFPEVINFSRDVYRVASMLQYQLLLWCFLGRKEYSSLSHRCFSVRPQPASIELHWAHFAKSENRRAGGLVSAAELYQTAEVWLANISMGANTDILTLLESPVQLLSNGHRWTSAHLRASASSSSPVGFMLPEAREAEKEESLLQGSSVPQYIYSFHRSLQVLLKVKLPSLLRSQFLMHEFLLFWFILTRAETSV